MHRGMVLVRLREIGERVREELQVARLVLQDERVPRAARWLLGLAVAYALSPVDVIPDFIPVLGHLDDAVIVGGLVLLASRWIPADVLEECRARARRDQASGEARSHTHDRREAPWAD